MELKNYLNVLVKKWWIVLPAFLITLTASLVMVYTQTPLYSTTTTYVVAPSSAFGDLKSFANGLDMLGRRDEIATTFTEIAMSRSIKQQAMDSISLESGRNYAVSGKLRAGTNVIEFTVQGPDPVITRDLVNAIGATTEEYVQGSYEVFVLRPLDEATTPSSPVSPNKTLSLTLAAILGLVLGAGLAFLSAYFEASVSPITEVNIVDNKIGVYNKDYFLRRLSNEMVRAKRNRYPLSVALMHVVDNLGLMNGANSNEIRAKILHQIGVLTSQYLREEDIVAYLGDDTFALLLPDMTGENAKAVMEYMQTRVNMFSFQPITQNTKLNLKSIVGVAAYNHNGTSRDDFVAQANRALHLAEVNENGSVYLIANNHPADYPNV
ncbi:MAG: diguanylate cyclase [Anaerolineales bacterium]|nr:diguanylate cyclase [Anaerolineales bacterium]